MPEATPTERGTDMIKAVIDRFEGEYAVAEISCSKEIFFIDILSSNFKDMPSEGDTIIIESVNGVPVSDENGLVSFEARDMLIMLENPAASVILISREDTDKRRKSIEALAADLFED